MITLILNGFIIAAFVFFIYKITADEMIFGDFQMWLKAKIPTWLFTPFVGCVYCMTPWWSTIPYFLMYGLFKEWNQVGYFILSITCAYPFLMFIDKFIYDCKADER